MKTIASLYSGIGLVECGSRLAGYQPIWGVEIEPQIRQLYSQNHVHADIHDWDLTKDIPITAIQQLQVPDVLHISPPCQSFSLARDKVIDGKDDVALANTIVKFITTLRPSTITFENVPGYQYSYSWRLIEKALDNNGYYLKQDVYDMADWGVPQNRKRFICVAKTSAFHWEIEPSYKLVTIKNVLFDVIGELKPAKLTQGQLNKINKSDYDRIESGELAIIQRYGIRDKTKVRFGDETSFTILAPLGGEIGKFSRESFLNVSYQSKIYNANLKVISRLMSAPDWFNFEGFPNNVTVSGLGNGVCPEFYREFLNQIG